MLYCTMIKLDGMTITFQADSRREFYRECARLLRDPFYNRSPIARIFASDGKTLSEYDAEMLRRLAKQGVEVLLAAVDDDED